MSQVDPFIQQIPRKFINDPELRPFFEYLNRFLHDLWVRTGAGDDAIANADVQEKYAWQLSPPAEQAPTVSLNIPLGATNQFNAISATSNYTACDYDFINASNGITVTFPQYPAENSVIIVRNGDGSAITISGNGKNINGDTSAILRSKYGAITFQYFIDDDEWFPR